MIFNKQLSNQPWWLSSLGRQLSFSRVEGINKRTVDRSLLGAISIIQKSKDFVAIPIAECRTMSMIYISRELEVGDDVCRTSDAWSTTWGQLGWMSIRTYMKIQDSWDIHRLVQLPRQETYNVTCKIDDWNIGLRRCPEKMSSLGGPTLKKKKKKKKKKQLAKWQHNLLLCCITWRESLYIEETTAHGNPKTN